MKILKSWLKEYIHQDISDPRLEEILMLSGLEIENVEKTLQDNIVVVKIKEIKKHPNADKLRIAIVDDGEKDIQVVCGAPNIKVGQVVPLALPGSVISGVTLKEANIRGENSHGMLCAQDELGIGDDHTGIFILPNDYQIGKPINQYISPDSIFELSVTANRGDCLSHVGIAREVAVYENSSIKREPISLEKTDSAHSSTEIDVQINEPELCPQYLARVIKGVKIAPSPQWLQDRLIACGAKPINNVVDITNYILLDLGHPMHAFDLKKIKNNKIIVRLAKKNEDLVSLDGELRNLDKEMLVIADADKAIAIAGVMGGQNSEIDMSTDTVVLEAAQFEPKNIRATSKKLKLATEASYRFERGIDAGGVEYAINKAANMIATISGGRVMSGIVAKGEKPNKIKIEISPDKIRSLLGLTIPKDEIDHILRLLGFSISDGKCEAPLWRHDISIWQDLAEEIGRVVGYDKIAPVSLDRTQKLIKTNYYRLEDIKDKLIDSGYCETINYPFLSENDLFSAGLKSSDLLEVANPLQPENRLLRNSLIPGLLKNVAKNPAFDKVLLFEIGHIFNKTREDQNLAIVSTEKSKEEFVQFVDVFAKQMEIDSKLFKIKFYQKGELISYKIKRQNVCVAEVNLSKAFENISVDQKLTIKPYSLAGMYRGVSKFPSLTRDLAFVVDKNIKSNEILQQIYKQSPIVNRVELFDEFVSDKFGADKKNLAYHIFLQAYDRTLTDDEAGVVIKDIIAAISNLFKAKLRS